MEKAIVLLSGGQDSTTCLYWAKDVGFDPISLSVFYGQRHRVELEAAWRIAKLAGVPHREHGIPALGEVTAGTSALVSEAPLTAAGGLLDREAPAGLPSSFVPGRNAMFLTLAASLAVVEGAKTIITGVCQTDYSGYPDCRREFIDAMAQALTLAMPSSCGPIKIETPLMGLTKADTVRMARKLPGCWEALALSVTCYQGQPACGVCPSCVLRAKGFAEAGETDPALG